MTTYYCTDHEPWQKLKKYVLHRDMWGQSHTTLTSLNDHAVYRNQYTANKVHTKSTNQPNYENPNMLPTLDTLIPTCYQPWIPCILNKQTSQIYSSYASPSLLSPCVLHKSGIVILLKAIVLFQNHILIKF
jgi:hypothetical protein